jgi:hypothetical protein
MRKLSDIPTVDGVPVRCDRCGAPLALYVSLFGPALLEAHDALHSAEDRADACERLLRLAEQVRDGAPPVVLGPAIDAYKVAFGLTMLN